MSNHNKYTHITHLLLRRYWKSFMHSESNLFSLFVIFHWWFRFVSMLFTHPNFKMLFKSDCFKVEFFIYFGLVWTLHWCQMLISIHWARERCNHFTNVISKHMLWMQLMSTSCEIALRWMPKNTFDLSQHWFRLWLGATCALMCFNELNHWQ